MKEVDRTEGRACKISVRRLLGLGMMSLLCVAGNANAGAIFTTDEAQTRANVNIFVDKEDVYLNGGPAHDGAARLDDGDYYVRVTNPNGEVLLGSSAGTPVHVTSGRFDVCYYRLWDLVTKASDGNQGYDDTTNPGGEYKVWVSVGADFADSRTDNFKVRATASSAGLTVVKFYDANANGLNDDGQLITGWKVRVQDGMDLIRYAENEI